MSGTVPVYKTLANVLLYAIDKIHAHYSRFPDHINKEKYRLHHIHGHCITSLPHGFCNYFLFYIFYNVQA